MYKPIIEFFQEMTFLKKVAVTATPFLSLFADVQAVVYPLLGLVFLDLLTGLRKSNHLAGIPANPFTLWFWTGRVQADGTKRGGVKSYLLRQTWRKLYEYVFGIMAIHLVEHHLLGGFEADLLGRDRTLTKCAVIMAGIIELWSIFENMEAVGGRNPLKKVASLLPEKVRKVLEG